MEFAIIVPALLAGTDDSWQPNGSRRFFVLRLVSNFRAKWVVEIEEILRILLIALFGAIGTLARYGLQGFVHDRAGGTFPYGTLIVNLTGCFFLGLAGQFTLNRMVISPDWRMAIGVGFFGGYTTFSSFGWETAKMLEEGEWIPASAYLAASVVAGLLLSVAGIRLANKL